MHTEVAAPGQRTCSHSAGSFSQSFSPSLSSCLLFPSPSPPLLLPYPHPLPSLSLSQPSPFPPPHSAPHPTLTLGTRYTCR